MSKNNSPPKQPGSYASAIELVNEHRSKANDLLLQECKACWDNGGHLTMELLKKFAWSGNGNEWLRNHYPFSPTFEAMAQIETAFEMLVQARASLIELYGHYHATLMYDGFELTEEVARKTTHEVFKYVFAASALVQAYRRFLKLAKHFTKEEMERIQCFPSRSREQVDFMVELRDPLGFCNKDLLEKLYDVFGC